MSGNFQKHVLVGLSLNFLDPSLAASVHFTDGDTSKERLQALSKSQLTALVFTLQLCCGFLIFSYSDVDIHYSAVEQSFQCVKKKKKNER